MFWNMRIKSKGQIGAGVIQRLAGLPNGMIESEKLSPSSPTPHISSFSQRFQQTNLRDARPAPPRPAPPPHLQGVVDGRLWRVDNEVSQCEAEALRGSPQAKRLGSLP